MMSCQKDVAPTPSASITNIPTQALASITSTLVTSITSTTAISGGIISTDGGAAITARGICWGITTSPTITGSHSTDGNGIGTFSSNLIGLTTSTIYYARAYATNSSGTSYGNEVNFTTAVPVVFVAGRDIIGFNNGLLEEAKIWINGVPSFLTTAPNTGRAFSIFALGTDVYVAGSETIGGGINSIARIWKNGVGSTLANGAEAYSIYVSRSDVYTCGIGSNGSTTRAIVWKNGITTFLTNGTNDAFASSVFVSGTDVYVGGYERSGTKDVAKIWKNGVATSLSNGINDNYINSIYVFGTNVYAVGAEYNGTIYNAKVWKNGVASILPSGSYANSIYVSVDGNVYIGGGESIPGNNDRGILWKNNILTQNPSSYGNEVHSVFVNGTDIYLANATYVANQGILATLWKNSTSTVLPTSSPISSDAFCVFVK